MERMIGLKPNIGDIYCVYVERLQLYAACQITRIEEEKARPLAAVLELDWTGDKLPTEEELDKMKPLYCDYYFWNNKLDHSYVTAQVPKKYILAGNRPPLVTEKTNSYSGGWHTGSSVLNQLKWRSIPEDRRCSFKEAAKDNTPVVIGNIQLARSASAVNPIALREFSDMSMLEQLPCLTRIAADRPYETLLPYVNGNPFIYELQLENHGYTSIDLRGSRLERLILQADGLEELFLNKGLTFLSLTGTPSPKLKIHAEDGGQWLTAAFTDNVPPVCGLERLSGLHVTQAKELDLGPVVRSYPGLKDLRLWGKPGNVVNLQQLEQLTNLSVFSTYDMFGFAGEEFPGPDRLPNLTWLWMTSLPADAAKAIKDKYKKEVPKGLDLSITKPRKPEWLAENLNNPFRDWDGREHITAAQAKKAMNLYKKTLAAISALPEQIRDGGMTANEAESALNMLVSGYTEAFNKMDRSSGFIETVEREEIYTVLEDLLSGAQQQLSAAGVAMDVDKLFGTFDQLRDF
ncbi:hypothetical protein [Paenibacillus elgii]|uniref:hypothetical protein n=1 Tax=Paenibacillus elgii TaxID=189691 RepID=UPI001CB9C2ED|nr:hypothetical protein [Paenibacillus elgii]